MRGYERRETHESGAAEGCSLGIRSPETELKSLAAWVGIGSVGLPREDHKGSVGSKADRSVGLTREGRKHGLEGEAGVRSGSVGRTDPGRARAPPCVRPGRSVGDVQMKINFARSVPYGFMPRRYYYSLYSYSRTSVIRMCKQSCIVLY